MFPGTTCHKSPIVSTAAVVANPSHLDRRSTSSSSLRCFVRVPALVFLILNVWVWGADATCPGGSPPVFIIQPESQFVFAPYSARLSAAVLCPTVSYRWYCDGVAIYSGTNSFYDVPGSPAEREHFCFVVASNEWGAATSAVARVTVLPDTVGPRVVEAVEDNNIYSRFGARTLAISFDESFLSEATNWSHYAVYAGTNYLSRLVFTNLTIAFALRPSVYLWMSDSRWVHGSNYFVLLNGIPDTKSNISFPHTRVGVTWRTETNLVPMSASWSYHAAAAFDPGIYTSSPPWYATSYSPGASPWWTAGAGLFRGTNAVAPACLGGSLGSTIPWQLAPTLFRHTFVPPGNLGTNSTLRLRHLTSEGLVVYLNGTEVYRYNASPGPVAAYSEALQNMTPDCLTVDLNAQLSQGGNTLAVALLRWNNAAIDDLLCGVELKATFSRTSPVAGEGPDPPRLRVDLMSGQPRLRWSTNVNGLGLQFKTNLNPSLPWITLPDQANPFVLPADGLTRFYRLYR